MTIRLRHICCLFVLAVFSLYLVPHELVHAFYDHEDTVHHGDEQASAELSPVHVHCDFLQTDITNFLPAEKPERAVCSVSIVFAYAEFSAQPCRNFHSFCESRGPPALV